MELRIIIGGNEFWYGMAANHGIQFPLNRGSQYDLDLRINPTGNQVAPLLLSSDGRYVWSEEGFVLHVTDGTMRITEAADDLRLHEGYGTLRKAFQAAAAAHFPADGRLPPRNFFTKPQYNTWAELIYDQNQKDILKYAHGILDHGLPPGILMIDDNWNRDYGNWEFDRAVFPDPKGMVDELHGMGFEVMLWSCPFISPDCANFRELEAAGSLVRNKDGSVAIKRWWNGYSAVLDMSNPKDVAWYNRQCRRLMDTYGIDGFKFDAGDANFYRSDDVTHAPVTPNGQSELWAKLGCDYPYNEYRACFKAAGLPLVQRLCDKAHRWVNGVDLLVPSALAQGILGYAFSCPDMIGGGSFVDFLPGAPSLDGELFVRYAQCAALMPMMQFSAAPWRVLDAEKAALCVEAAKLHIRFADLIYTYAEKAAKANEPIIRYMEYQFPHEGLAACKDQFMLGDNILVAPVWHSGERERAVMLPKGQWKYADGKVHQGGQTVTVPAPLSVLPWFERV